MYFSNNYCIYYIIWKTPLNHNHSINHLQKLTTTHPHLCPFWKHWKQYGSHFSHYNSKFSFLVSFEDVKAQKQSLAAGRNCNQQWQCTMCLLYHIYYVRVENGTMIRTTVCQTVNITLCLGMVSHLCHGILFLIRAGGVLSFSMAGCVSDRSVDKVWNVKPCVLKKSQLKY